MADPAASSTLPLRTLPVLEQWSCHTCGSCCKGHTVLLDDDDVARIRGQGWDRHPDFAGTPVIVPIGFWDRRPVVAQRPDGSCVFLTADMRCRIHAEFGAAAKPWACRMFPYQALPAGDHIRFTMRRTCPSAAANRGQPLAEQLDAVRLLLPKALPNAERIPPPPIVRGAFRPWPETRLITDRLERIMLDERLPTVRRLVAAVKFVDLLAECRWRKVAVDQLPEVARVFEQSARDAAAARFQAREPPGRFGAILFRQTAAEYLRFHPNLGDRPSLADRWRLFRAALAIARGRGALPAIHPALPPATFADLERPLGPLPDAALAPINAYFAALTASLQYCGAGRFGWSVVDGFRALALAFPVSLWALRWLSCGRAPTNADAIQATAMLDRSHYYPLLAGARHRHRLTMLARLGDLERLIVWYAR